MKKYLKELLIILIELLVFYITPLTAGPADGMGLVVLIIILTFILAIIMGIISKNKIKWVYPLLVGIIFLPSVMIYYNESAFIHSIWYIVDSYIGVILGHLIFLLRSKYGK